MSKRSTNKTNTTAAIAYYRVSTAKQGMSGLGLEAQRAAVIAYARSAGLEIAAEFVEVETGTSKRERVEIHRAISAAKQAGGTLLIAKLDRLARNVHFISGLMESGVSFVAVDNPSVTPLTLHVLAAVAEQEAQMISARTTAALQAAKRRGVTLGKPENLTHEAQQAGAAANRARAVDANRQAACLAAKMRTSGASLREIADELNGAGFSTRTGARFEAMQVKRMLDRLPVDQLEHVDAIPSQQSARVARQHHRACWPSTISAAGEAHHVPRITAHGLRAGLITAGAIAGASTTGLRAQSGHESESAFSGYVRDSGVLAMDAVLKAMGE